MTTNKLMVLFDLSRGTTTQRKIGTFNTDLKHLHNIGLINGVNHLTPNGWEVVKLLNIKADELIAGLSKSNSFRTPIPEDTQNARKSGKDDQFETMQMLSREAEWLKKAKETSTTVEEAMGEGRMLTDKQMGIDKTTRPPLGIVPRFIKAEQRKEEIISAMSRYVEASKPVPTEWAQELVEIVEWLRNQYVKQS